MKWADFARQKNVDLFYALLILLPTEHLLPPKCNAGPSAWILIDKCKITHYGEIPSLAHFTPDQIFFG